MKSRRSRRVGLLAIACAAGALAGPPQAFAGEPLLTVGIDVIGASTKDATYSLLVANRGSATATGVVLTNKVPARMTFSHSDRPPLAPGPGAPPCESGAAAGTECRWALGDLPPEASQTVTVTYALEQEEAAYPSFGACGSGCNRFGNTASAQLGNAASTASDPADTDVSLVRESRVLTEDAYVDQAFPKRDFGGCDKLLVRRDNGQTAFVGFDAFGAFSAIETLGGAELRASAAPPTAAAEPIPVAVHRVVSHDWDEGTACGTADGSGRQVTAEAKPPSEASPTAIKPVSGPGPVSWDVTRALDTPDERRGFNGFELRSGGPAGTLSAGDTVTFHSSEAAAANQPRLVTIGISPEGARCIDSDPEEASGPSNQQQRIDAYVTDGFGPSGSAKVSNSSGDDGCIGTPVSGVPVEWMLDDDSPDAYISSLAGTEGPREVGSSGDAGPNKAVTRTDGDGRAFIGIRVAKPYEEGANAGENRIAAIILVEQHAAQTQDPSVFDTDGVCEPGERPEEFLSSLLIPPCSGTGESDIEDDVKRTWTPAPPDTTPPETTIDSGPEGAVRSGDVSFAFSSSEPRSSFECRLDGEAFSACFSPKGYSGLPEGSHSFEVRAIDEAGNPDPTPAQRSFSVDQTPPETTIDSGPAGTVSGGDVSFAFSSNEAGSSFECRLDGQSFSACSSPKGYSGLAEGSHTFRVRALDAAGNRDPTSAVRSFMVTSSAPGAPTPAAEEESALAVPTPVAANRELTLSASPERVRPGGDISLSGRLSSTAAGCSDAGELIRLLRRSPGGAYGDFATVTTGADGRFQLPVNVDKSADYLALAPAHSGCAETSSAPASVEVKARLIARSTDAKVRRGERVAIKGRVLPDHKASEVVLERRRKGRWADVASRTLDAKPKYRFRMRARWSGRRLFRVRWEALHEHRLLGVSRTLGIATRPEGRAPRR